MARRNDLASPMSPVCSLSRLYRYLWWGSQRWSWLVVRGGICQGRVKRAHAVVSVVVYAAQRLG